MNASVVNADSIKLRKPRNMNMKKIRFTGDNWRECLDFCPVANFVNEASTPRSFTIPSTEINQGDWIVKNNDGSFSKQEHRCPVEAVEMWEDWLKVNSDRFPEKKMEFVRDVYLAGYRDGFEESRHLEQLKVYDNCSKDLRILAKKLGVKI